MNGASPVNICITVRKLGTSGKLLFGSGVEPLKIVLTSYNTLRLQERAFLQGNIKDHPPRPVFTRPFKILKYILS